MRLTHPFCAAVVCVALLPMAHVRQDQAPPPAMVAGLLGDWRGAGTVTGRPSEISMSWSRDMNGAFVHLRFRNAMSEGAGRPAEVFEGRGYYRLAPGTPTDNTGVWIDSRGYIMPIVVTLGPDTLTSEWGSASTERGRTVYRLIGGALEVIDSVRTADGQYREFGRSRLTRGVAREIADLWK